MTCMIEFPGNAMDKSTTIQPVLKSKLCKKVTVIKMLDAKLNSSCFEKKAKTGIRSCDLLDQEGLLFQPRSQMVGTSL